MFLGSAPVITLGKEVRIELVFCASQCPCLHPKLPLCGLEAPVARLPSPHSSVDSHKALPLLSPTLYTPVQILGGFSVHIDGPSWVFQWLDIDSSYDLPSTHFTPSHSLISILVTLEAPTPPHYNFRHYLWFFSTSFYLTFLNTSNIDPLLSVTPLNGPKVFFDLALSCALSLHTQNRILGLIVILSPLPLLLHSVCSSFCNLGEARHCIPFFLVPDYGRWMEKGMWSESHSVVSDSSQLHGFHGILQARILEWVAFPFSRGSSQPRDQTQVFHIALGFFTSWATREAQEYWSG